MQPDDTVVFAKIIENELVFPGPPPFDRLGVLRDALDLVAELWPNPPSATVVLETHQWVKLRRTLLAIPELMINDEQ